MEYIHNTVFQEGKSDDEALNEPEGRKLSRQVILTMQRHGICQFVN